MKTVAEGSNGMQLEQALKGISSRGWFAECADTTRMLLSDIARLRRFASGSVVYVEGDSPDGLYGLVSGSLNISIPRADGSDFTFHRADTGFWIGDLALVAGAKRLVSVRAASDAEVIHLRSTDMEVLLADHPWLYRDLYRLSYVNFATTFFLLSNISLPSSTARVALRLLLQLEQAPDPEGRVSLSQSNLAELVALSEPTLQRVLRQLSDLNCIEQKYRHIRIIDRTKLLELCGDNVELAQFR